MPPFRKPSLVTLRRQNPNQPWGFRLGGGADIGQPFQIQKVTPDSLAYLGGLSEGDELVRIGNISLRGLTHDEVQQIIMRCTHCIDLFILTEDGREPQPRIRRSEEIISERSDIPYMDRPPHFPPMGSTSMFKPPVYNNNLQQQQQQQSTVVFQLPQNQHNFDDQNNLTSNQVPNQQVFGIKSAPQMMQQPPSPQQSSISPQPMQNGGQDFNHSPQPFENQIKPESNQFKPIVPNNTNQNMDPNRRRNEPIRPEAQQAQPQPQQPQSQQQQQQQQQQQPMQKKPDMRVFGVNPRSPSKSPFKFHHSVSMTPSNTENSASPGFSQQQQQQQQQPHNQQQPRISQSTPSTPTANKNFNFNPEQGQQLQQNDSNNNPVQGDKKVYGLPNRIGVKPIDPIGNHGVQPIQNEKKFFGVNPRQRLNSVSSDRDWKDPLPIVQIPNVDLLLPSQTRKLQTYINQIPPTEKNLRPSLAGLQRRKIRPQWPPPLPRVNKGAFTEGRDSPNSRMYAWPPSRAQSVDRDFGYGEPQSEETRRAVYSRVRGTTRIWPPPSNATPAGKSGYIPDENDEDNYAYNPSREPSPAPSWVSSHIPITYRPPPGTQYQPQALINDF